MPRIGLTISLIVGSLAVASCARAGTVGAPPTPGTTEGAASPADPSATSEPFPTPTSTRSIPDTGWQQLSPGLEHRTINLLSGAGEPFEHVVILRLEPDLFQFDVAYHPQPQLLDAWQSETDALIIMNGGYFRLEQGEAIPNGLTVIGGEPMGKSYGDFGGMLAITRDGPELRWLAQTPYDPNEPLIAALQSFPVLVKPGGELGFPEEEEDNRPARRSVIGMDGNGRMILIVASLGNFTLHELSTYLVESDLDLDIAVNLDGGPSSGMLLADPYEEVSSQSPLPIVITIHRR